jgi:hypothetical protein
MRVRVVAFFSSLILSTACGRNVGAQVATEATSAAETNTALRKAIGNLRPQSEVRVGLSGSVTRGWLRHSTQDTLWIESSGTGMTPVAVNRIDKLWSRENSAAQGAFIGGLLGALFLGAIGATADKVVNDILFCDPAYCESSGGSNAAVGALVGGFGGAVVGIVIGTRVRRWQSRYP